MVLASLLFSLGALAGTSILLGVILLWRRREKAEGRRNPLSSNLMRSPGQSIQAQLDDLRWDVAMYLSIGMLPVPLGTGFLLAHWVTEGKPPGVIVIAAVSIFSIGILGWLGWRLWNALRLIRNRRLGYDAELAVGQELNELLRNGYRVFHDLPAENQKKFNIDHVVVGPGGVFAIETKGRSKPSPSRAQSTHWEVTYDGSTLQFPGWRETDPIRQVEGASRWLQKALSRSTGEEVNVRLVLVLPGWFVKRISPNGIPVLASGQILGFFSKAARVLDDKTIDKIAYQLELKCRDVVPGAYRPQDAENT